MLYTDRDRASNKRIMLTVGITVAFLAAIVLVAGLVVGSLFSQPNLEEPPEDVSRRAPAAPTVEPESTSASSIETAPVESESEPAPVVQSVPLPKPKPAPAEKPKSEPSGGVVVIDAGHQKRADLSLEPIGPGASEKKPKVQGGASGVVTRNAESSINLKVAKKLRDELESRGVKVIMVRETQDVNVANSRRAKIANEADADLFIRLHCDGSGGSSATGLSTLIPAKNRWTGPILAESKKAGRAVHSAVIRSTDAKDRGVIARSDLSGFNWSEVPTVLVEMGFMSNPTEDRKLGTSAYQDKLAEGMAEGIVAYIRQ